MVAQHPDRGGRPVNLADRARRIVRQQGLAWLATLEQQARLGDVAAIQALLTLANQLPPANGPGQS